MKTKFIYFILLGITMLNAQNYKYTNDLINEDSPYLLQHSHNPVNWHAWNEKSLKKAKDENKMIFLSIGYSTCHWCHVMEEESFEDEQVAKILNDHYISIKIDREEMPSLDAHFQEIFNLMNKRAGGWPLTIIMTPDAKVFFSGTYIPKEPRYNMTGLVELLNYFVNLQRTDYAKILKSADSIEDFQNNLRLNSKNTKVYISNAIIDRYIDDNLKSFDTVNKGIGSAPKFPHASTLNTLLDIYKLTKNTDALKMATSTLSAMANGGIYDQIENGFYRYSVDEKWMIPHFEKMLYTNGELLEAYSKAYYITKDEQYKQIATDLVNFIDKRFKEDDVYYSASDADSLNPQLNKKEEGFYFVYDYNEALEALEKHRIQNPKEILSYLHITPNGNFEDDLNNPYLIQDSPKPHNLEDGKKVLLDLRANKPYPFIDNKILTAWNSIYINSLYLSSNIDNNFISKANKSLESLLNKIYKDGKLYHQVVLGKSLKVEALFEDYSLLIQTLLTAYEINLDNKYLHLANSFTKEAIKKFYKQNIWYASDDKLDIKATIDGNAYRSYLSVMVDNFLKLASLEENLDYQNLAHEIIESNSLYLSKYPSSYSDMLTSWLAYHNGYITIKSTKENLSKIKGHFNYPFILYKATNENEYLACKVDSCFAHGKDMDKFIEQINKTIKK